VKMTSNFELYTSSFSVL